VECTLFPIGVDQVEVRFDAPLRDIAPGQGAVFYDGDLCLGGGVIARAEEPMKTEIKE
jgi:tRNA-specific 2-thiouridylase